MNLKKLSCHKSFGGQQLQYSHESTTLGCTMQFSIFLPSQAEQDKVPVIYWLSGLTCTDENFVQKAGAQQYAEKLGVAIVAPDTSPRGDGVPDDPQGAYDLGLGAGFYLNATQEPWAKHYHMEDYIARELPALVNEHFPIAAGRAAIMGHSMGGHGALTIALKYPDNYRSVSAFAPICSPMHCPWGQKALRHYLGEDLHAWRAHDTTELIKNAIQPLPLFVDQGEDDTFLETQLKPELLKQACEAVGHPLTLRMQPGYDHSYFFIASLIGEHIAYHAAALGGPQKNSHP